MTLLEKVRRQLRDPGTPTADSSRKMSPRTYMVDADDGLGQDESVFVRKLAEGFVPNAAGDWVLAEPIERLVEQEVEAVHHCMLVCHDTSDEMGCLLTLRAAPRSAGPSPPASPLPSHP